MTDTNKYFCYLALLIFSLTVSYPVLSTEYFVAGWDWFYPFAHIEGMKACILGGQFPVRVCGYTFNGYGELSGIFYPNLFLYIPIFFRLLDIPWITSYNIFCVIINIATVFIAYWSFSRLFNSIFKGTVAAMIYAGFFYRLVDIYSRSAIGETLAMTFMPLALVGLWLILYKSDRYWPAVVIGFTGIFQSHILSSVISSLFALLFVICSYRQFFQNYRAFAKIVLFTAVLNVWFYVPFINFYNQIPFYMKFQSMKANVHLLSESVYDFTNFLHTQAFCGFITLFIIFTFIILWCRNKSRNKYFVVDKTFWCVLLVGIGCTSVPFSRPLCHILEAIPFIGSHVSVIQFPYRFMILGSLALTYCLTVAVIQISNWLKTSKIIVILAAFCIFITNILYLNYAPKFVSNFFLNINHFSFEILADKMYAERQLKLDLNDFQKYYKFAYPDYIYEDITPKDLFYDMDSEDWAVWNECFAKESKIPFDDIKPAELVTNFNKQGVTVSFTSNIEHPTTFTLPLFYYPGYQAFDSNGKNLKISEGLKHRLIVEVPAGENNVVVKYVDSPLWRVANFISLLGILLFIFQIYREQNYRRGKLH